ncbi:MMPL family transporter [Salinibacterium sp. dk2585]|uniref:MMPL family transporter n=1 Tax=unclassified Salinibacterium TaxID=2632331 RepID=UPI0011C255DF|nr:MULTISPECIES: MMPL family transporter [unclassified Salinibacterium]QEE60266.1 MMPL family transporter [Salinibacterium sp. dk2585]TXK55338.1 MMPL family transporter [Salinibacterium sp. dk5596]
MKALRHFITSARTSWIVLVVAALASAALLAFGAKSEGGAPANGLPESAESAKVAALQEDLPGADESSALIVFTRDGDELTDDDMAAIMERSQELIEFSSSEFLPPATASEDGTAALLPIPLDVIDNVEERADRAADIRSTANDGLPDGLVAYMTGGEGFAVDLAGVFAGANFTLLGTTVIVVAILLIVTYRSPWLWLVPLAVVGLADTVAAVIANMVASAFEVELDASITGILSVLVFGAGTNYALLLIARYRDELRSHEDRREAMNVALKGAGPAIIASGGTVALSLATLLFAELTGNRALGIACAAGILVAMAFALFVLPAALVLFNRKLFWPYVPKVTSEDRLARGFWFRLGTLVSKRPAIVAIVGIAILAGLATAVPGVKVGLAQTERFTSTPEAVVGQEIIADAFSAGSGSPAIVIANADAAEQVVEAALEIDGVDSARIVDSNDEIAEINVQFNVAAETEEAFALVEELRAELDSVEGADALVGGIDAESLDQAAAQERDEMLVIPLILVVVFVVLVLLLRSLLAPIILLLTVVGSFFASVGASWLLFQSVFDFPALDTSVLLFSFLFLVALGVDYNIFLVTRAKEEAEKLGTRRGMVRALSATGGVITSAGILLAAVFAVLGVLPLITLTQIGIIVCVGVLIDTLLVRTVIVPAFAFMLGDWFWWPRHGRMRQHSAAESAPVEDPAEAIAEAEERVEARS